jgi:hypothetical protein
MIGPDLITDISALEVAHQIAQKQSAIMKAMRTALESGDEKTALIRARELCGMNSTN